jgi:putative endonuclease
MLYYVYILKSLQNGRYYVGQTNDLKKRLSRHNTGSEPATSPYVPWEIIWHTTKPSRAESIELERKLKNLSRIRLETFIKKYGGS